jgi:aspartate dehydrogenase
MLKVGMIGYGAIGKDAARYIKEKKAGDAELTALLVRSKEKYKALEQEGYTVCDDEQAFFRLGLDVIIENAGHEAVYQYGEKALTAGSDLMVVSVGAFADPQLLEQVQKAAEKHKRRLILPSAAIAGLDRIAAAMLGTLDEVKLVTRKPPNAWRGTIAESKVALDSVTEPVCIYNGSARESSKLFPESTNVSAALSLAGIGFDDTKVEVYVDPRLQRNTHQIIAKGQFGEVEIQVQNTPSADNPKSGCIVAMSICKALKNLTSPILIGI